MLEVARRSNFSNGGQLKDLFIDIEGITPGEYKNRGADLSICYSFLDTQFGICLVASTPKGICNVLFADSRELAWQDLQSRWSKATLIHKVDPLHKSVQTYLSPLTPKSKIKLHVYGTNFQLKVWKALLSIPEGAIATYADIAERVGNKKWSRAVGAAIGNNPIGYIIPCHRVLKTTGEIGGYRWGVERKRAMLGYEAIRRNEK